MAAAAPGPRLYRWRHPPRTLRYRAIADPCERFLGVDKEHFEPTHGYRRNGALRVQRLIRGRSENEPEQSLGVGPADGQERSTLASAAHDRP